MWKFNLAVLASTVVMASGCTQGTPGGPGVQKQPVTENRTVTNSSGERTETHTTSKPVISDSRDTFSLKGPMLSTSIKQGETKSVTISISRGTDFTDDVNLKFSAIPNGVTISPASPTIAASDKEAKIDVAVSDTAALGEHTVKVTGHPMKSGQDAESEFKLTIATK